MTKIFPLILHWPRAPKSVAPRLVAFEFVILASVTIIASCLIGLLVRYEFGYDLGVVTGVLLGPALITVLVRPYQPHLPWLRDERL